MSIFGLLFLIIAQFLTGRGILGMFNIRLKPLLLFVVSQLVGIVTFSLVPMFMEMMHIRISYSGVLITLIITTVLFNILPARKYDYSILKPANLNFKWPPLYETGFIALFFALMLPSLWRCFYFPPFARDVLSGPEALAEFAIREGSINNSVFKQNLLESTPNLLKPPFVTNLQIIYKLFVQPFGQLWLSIMAVCFLVWIYNLLREKLHPLVACFLMLFFFTIPEVYGYSYIILWDYANMIYFFGGAYFLLRYIESKEYNMFLFSCLLFGFATFVRLETLIFIALLSPAMVLALWKDKVKITKIALNLVLLAAIPFAFYFIWVNIFVKFYLPINLDADQALNLGTKTTYLQWLSEINSQLIFGGINLVLYGYYIYFFLLVLIADTLIFRKLNRESRYMLWGVAVIYFGMPLLGYFTQWFNTTTAKRGFFKMFPLMLMYMRSNSLFTWLSNWVINFENGIARPKQTSTVTAQNTGSSAKAKKKKTGRDN